MHQPCWHPQSAGHPPVGNSVFVSRQQNFPDETSALGLSAKDETGVCKKSVSCCATALAGKPVASPVPHSQRNGGSGAATDHRLHHGSSRTMPVEKSMTFAALCCTCLFQESVMCGTVETTSLHLLRLQLSRACWRWGTASLGPTGVSLHLCDQKE